MPPTRSAHGPGHVFAAQTAANSELRRFGFSAGAGVALIFGLVRPWLRHYPTPYWPWIVALLLWLTALVYAPALSFAFRGLNQVGRGFAWLVTLLLCAVVYYGLFAPVGLAMRALGRDALGRGFDPALASYRVPSRQRSRESMERPF